MKAEIIYLNSDKIHIKVQEAADKLMSDSKLAGICGLPEHSQENEERAIKLINTYNRIIKRWHAKY